MFSSSHTRCAAAVVYFCIEFFCSDTLAGSFSIYLYLSVFLLFSPYFCRPVSLFLYSSSFVKLLHMEKERRCKNISIRIYRFCSPVHERRFLVRRSSFPCNIVSKRIDADVSIPCASLFLFLLLVKYNTFCRRGVFAVFSTSVLCRCSASMD